MNTIIKAAIVVLVFSAPLFSISQDCTKYLKKDKGGVVSTKDQTLGRILVNSHMLAFTTRKGNNCIEYYLTEIHDSNPLMDAAVESALVDTLRIDLKFASKKEFSFRAYDTEMGGISLKGVALMHYYSPLTEEELKVISSERIREYRVFKYSGNKEVKLDEKKWKPVDSGNALEILNAAKCFSAKVTK